MDLSKIRKKLRNGHYIIPNDIIRDVQLIFSNAKAYNARGTMVIRLHDYITPNQITSLVMY